jgi:CRP/FNR family transcriptional regulator, nitrogen fixation regulation protein
MNALTQIGPRPEAIHSSATPAGEWGCMPVPRTQGAPLNALAAVANPVVLAAGDELFEQDDPVTYCYQVVSGCVRTVRLMEDGRRQIGGFLMPGDVLGFDAGSRHDHAAQAVSAAVLRRYPVHSVLALAERDAGFALWLWRTAAGQLHRAREHAVLLGRMTATERVARFLCDMRSRAGQVDKVDDRPGIALPMQRADIADYLGLTVETVSRTLTQLRRARAIDVEPGRIVVKSARALAELAADMGDDAADTAGLAGLAPSRIGDSVTASRLA